MSTLKEISEMYLAKFELAKLKVVDKATNSFASVIGLGIILLVSLFFLLSVLVLCATMIGYFLSNYIAGLISFTVLLAIVTFVIVHWKNNILIKPLKNFLIKTLYENGEGD